MFQNQGMATTFPRMQPIAIANHNPQSQGSLPSSSPSAVRASEISTGDLPGWEGDIPRQQLSKLSFPWQGGASTSVSCNYLYKLVDS